MPPFRNPFGKRPPTTNGLPPANDENQRPSLASDQASQGSSLAGSRASSSLSIKPKKEEAGEYKLSVYDSGVYLPPSPPEKKSFWAKAPSFNGSNNHRSVLNENEPFSISRESFDSYRRSFDISARSPVPQTADGFTPRQSTDARQSMDSAKANIRSSRPALKDLPLDRPEPTAEEPFEDVGLNDDSKKDLPNKKKGIFARFGDSNSEPAPAGGDAARPTSSHRGFHLPGRKRGQSGQGAELGHMERTITKSEHSHDDDGVVR